MKNLLSTLTFKPSCERKGILLTWLFLFIFFISIISLNIFIDPFFIFRSSPFEPRMELIDSHQRFAKSLQVMTRRPHTIILGSSRVYRGFDVGDGVYNMGVSSLTLTEAVSYTQHILRFTSARRLILGLDFWMWDNNTLTQIDWDENMGTFFYSIQSFFYALLKPNDSLHTLRKYFSSTQGTGEGWTYGGFFRTGKRSTIQIDKMLHAYTKHFETAQIDLKQFSLLEDIIHQCHSKGVELYVYISPIHPKTKAIYMQSKSASSFNPWREGIQRLCESEKIPFRDFTDLLEASPSLAEGSTEFWLDYSHFSPQVGRIILQSFGIIEEGLP